MRKNVAYFIILSVFFMLSSTGVGTSFSGEGLHTFYFSDKSSCAVAASMPEDEAERAIYVKSDKKGESAVFYSAEKVKRLLLSLGCEKIFSEKGEDFDCDYYYSPEVPTFCTVNGLRVNVHVAKAKDRIVVGIPFIFGGY